MHIVKRKLGNRAGLATIFHLGTFCCKENYLYNFFSSAFGMKKYDSLKLWPNTITDESP